MIRYNLICELDHTFEGWFRNSEDYEVQNAANQVECPVCTSTDISKVLMAPAVSTSRKREARVIPASDQVPMPANSGDQMAAAVPAGGVLPQVREAALLPQDLRQKEIVAALRQLRSKMLENSENVGDKFAEEARKIHYGDAEERAIHGQTSAQDVADLVDEGISILPLPVLPEDNN